MVVCAMWSFLLAVFTATLLLKDVCAQTGFPLQNENPLQCYNTSGCSNGSERGNLRYSQCCSEGLEFFKMNGTCYGCRDLISFSRKTYSVPESGRFVRLVVQRTVNPGTVQFYFKLVIKQGTATGGQDYGQFPESTSELIGLMLTNEMETGSGVVIREDRIVENEEYFTASLQLLSSSLSPLGGYLQTTVVAIVDDDKATIVVLPVNNNATNLTALEGDPPIHFSINKIGETVRNVSVDLLPPAGHDVTYTMNGAVLSEVTRLTFAPNELQKFLVVTVTDDVIVEASERHDIVLSIPVNETGVDLLNPSFPLTVEDNDKLDVDMVVPAVSVTEDGGYVVLQLVKKGQNERSVFVNFSTEGGSAKAGVDFSVVKKTLEFRDIDTHLSVNVTIIDDLIVESTETFSCQVEPAEGERGVVVTNSTTSVSITDSDTIIIHVDPSSLSVSEGEGTALIFLRVEGEIARDIVVDVSRRPSDTRDLILPVPSTVTFDPSSQNHTYPLSVVDDNLYEGAESVTIAVTSSDRAVRFSRSPAEVIVSVTDNDSPQLSFSQSVYMFNETAGTVQVSVTFAAQTERSHTWNLNFIAVSATENEDYNISSTSRSLTFNNNIRSHIVSFQIIDDELSEGLENFTIVLQGQGGDIVAESTVVIVDNEKLKINFGKPSYLVSEGDRFVLLEITKSGLSSSDIIVDIILEDGTAKGGVDYGFFPSETVELQTVIAMQDTSTQYGVLIREDDIIENTEFFNVSLSLKSLPNRDGSIILGNATHVQVAIKDNDKVMISLTLENSTVISEASADLTLVFTVSRDPNVTFDRSRAVVVMLTALENTATEPEDYSLPSPHVFTFSQNATSYHPKLAVRNDDIVENAEQFSVALVTAPTELGAILPDNSTIITITSEDKIKVSFGRISYTVSEGGGVATIAVVKEGTNEIPVLVSVETRTIAATAKAGEDFNSSIQPLEFLSAGPSRLALTIPILDDSILESDEGFTVQLVITANDTNVELGNSTAVNVTIVDNDRVAVEFSQREVRVGEEDGGATVTVVLVGEIERDVIVMLSTKNGTADSTDYTPLTTTLTFRSGEQQKNVTLNIINDNECEEDEETFSVSLSSPDADSRSINVTIVDDETCGVGFERIVYTVTEPVTSQGKKPLQVCIIRSGSHSQKDNTMVVVAGDVPNIPLEQRATANSDFILVPRLLMLPSDQNSTCTNITIIGDSLAENTEKFMIRLVVADEDVQTFNSEANVSIIDRSEQTPNESLPRVEFESASYSVNESSRQVEITIVLEGMRDPSQFIGVIFSTSDGTATAPRDFVAQPNTAVPFPPGSNHASVVVVIEDDSQVEVTESFTVSLSLPPTSIGLKLGAQTTATITISDSGAPGVVVNDTVLGDPLFVVPLNFADGRQLFGDNVPLLCFEIHGQSNWYFNLVSDICTSVNAFYESGKNNNIITKIGVKAIDSFNRCVQIEVNTGSNCMPVVSRGGMQVAETQYSEAGISVSKRGRGARISVPNCAAQQLVMWITCSQGQIRFDIARGLTLRPTSHGLIGQFWNIPIKVTPFNFHGQVAYDLQMQDLYQIEVNHINSFPRRFVAELYDLTWDRTRNDHCLYAGDQQGGRILEISNPNDPVIQGRYTFYRTQGLFETHFRYSQFNESLCS